MARICFIFLLLCAISAQAEKILIVTDSHGCGSFGENMVSRLSLKGHQATLYCTVSSAPQHWIKGQNPKGQSCKSISTKNNQFSPCLGNGKTPELTRLLDAHQDSLIIVALGTNSLMSPNADRSYSTMANIIHRYRRECLWIGPPHLNASQSKGFPRSRVEQLENNLESFYKSLDTSVSSYCTLLDSRKFTARGSIGNQTVDGVHRTRAAGKEWSKIIDFIP